MSCSLSSYVAFVRRSLRALGRRLDSSDPENLSCLISLSSDLDALLRSSVSSMRKQGYSWDHIGSSLGVSRQAAFKRFGSKEIRSEKDS